MNIVVGLDVSTSCTGVCVIDPSVEMADGGRHILYLGRIDFKGCDTLWEKADVAKSFLESIRETHRGKYAVHLEEPLMGFRTGMSSASTITTLMRFNGIVSYLSRQVFGVDPLYISSATARKTCGIKMLKTAKAGMSGKEQVFKHMMEHDLKHVVWPKKKNGTDVDWSRDAVDAYVIARAATILSQATSNISKQR